MGGGILSGGNNRRTVYSTYVQTLVSGKTLQRNNTENWIKIFPEKELCGNSPNFHIHVSARDFYIPTIDLPSLL